MNLAPETLMFQGVWTIPAMIIFLLAMIQDRPSFLTILVRIISVSVGFVAYLLFLAGVFWWLYIHSLLAIALFLVLFLIVFGVEKLNYQNDSYV